MTGNYAPSTDGRYIRFLQAVEALRLGHEPSPLTEERIARLIAESPDFFLIGDGLPQEVKPLPPDAKSRIKPPEIRERVEPEETQTYFDEPAISETSDEGIAKAEDLATTTAEDPSETSIASDDASKPEPPDEAKAQDPDQRRPQDTDEKAGDQQADTDEVEREPADETA